MSPEDRDLLAKLDEPLRQGSLSVNAELGPLLKALEGAFPFPGNRLEWTLVPNTVTEMVGSTPDGSSDIAESAKAFAVFIESMTAQHRLAGTVVVLGDGFVDLAVCGEVSDVTKYLPVIANYPQHTYVFPYPVVSWCASLMMEGYMDFAFAPSRGVEDA
jgi:hypothetical protein